MREYALLGVAAAMTLFAGCASPPESPGAPSPEAAASLYLSSHERAVWSGDPDGYRRMWELLAPGSRFRQNFENQSGFATFRKWLEGLDLKNRPDLRAYFTLNGSQKTNDTSAIVFLNYTVPDLELLANQTLNDTVQAVRMEDGTWKLDVWKCCAFFNFGFPENSSARKESLD